jgi:hypothetical protein
MSIPTSIDNQAATIVASSSNLKHSKIYIDCQFCPCVINSFVELDKDSQNKDDISRVGLVIQK